MEAVLIPPEEIIDNMEIANDDILLVELPYKGSFVFSPTKSLEEFNLD